MGLPSPRLSSSRILSCSSLRRPFRATQSLRPFDTIQDNSNLACRSFVFAFSSNIYRRSFDSASRSPRTWRVELHGGSRTSHQARQLGNFARSAWLSASSSSTRRFYVLPHAARYFSLKSIHFVLMQFLFKRTVSWSSQFNLNFSLRLCGE